MDLCVFDWKSIAPIIAALIASSIAATTALYISNKWSGQKGSEVVANEAKNVAIDLEEVESIYLELLSYEDELGMPDYFNNIKSRLFELLDKNQKRLSFMEKFVATSSKLRIISKYKAVLKLIDSKFYNSKSGEKVETYVQLMENIEDDFENGEIIKDLQVLADVCREIALYRFTLNKTKNEPVN
ncbi:hypothetical protein [Acinetobacter rudis]|uniref:Uncharacterized protein n=1 Tax=Acinetobacter rudis CIP 110305 TaxID=421052 RepID=S3P4P0_9GAMM|nr:hypothetical protein [Acinetobacter rudis]EPF73781.1 hypothetical protein F945_01940 [Acinetobacter rudis CIP 110305]